MDKIVAFIEGWREKLLSYAGKATFIMYVLQSIPMYVMICFMMPILLWQKAYSLIKKL